MKIKKAKFIRVAAALIRKDGKVFLAKRAKGELAGYWEFPGGKIEKGETSKEAIIREIKEELGIDIIPVQVVGTFQHEYDFAVIKMTLIECKIADDVQIILDGSHSEYTWTDLKNHRFHLTPMDNEIIYGINI
jgi:8-oxo-dGTP diphosphatase